MNEAFELPEPIAYAATCSTPSGIFYAGGENENGIASRSYLLKWDKRIQKLVTDELPGLPIGLVNAACANFAGNTVFIAGGETKEGVSASCWSLDLEKSKDGWKALPALPVPVSHAVLAVVEKDGWPQLFLFGGRRKNQSGISELYSAVYTLNLLQKEWVAKPSLPYSLSAGTGLAAGEMKFIYLAEIRAPYSVRWKTAWLPLMLKQMLLKSKYWFKRKINYYLPIPVSVKQYYIIISPPAFSHLQGPYPFHRR